MQFQNYSVAFFSDFLKARKALIQSELAKVVQIPVKKAFWNGLEHHFEIFNEKLSSKEIVSAHIMKSLERCHEDGLRTDQMLYFLVKSKAFEPNQFLEEKSEEYRRVLCHFIWYQIHNPKLYAFLELREQDNVVVDDGHSFSQLFKQIYNFDDSFEWVRLHFFQNFDNLVGISSTDPSRRLEERLEYLHLLLADPSYTGLIWGGCFALFSLLLPPIPYLAYNFYLQLR